MKQAPPLDDKKATACSATCRARPCNEQTLQDGLIKRAPQNRFCIFTRHGETVEKNLYVHIQIQNFRSPLPTSKTPFLCSEKEDSGPRNYSSRRLSVLSNIVFLFVYWCLLSLASEKAGTSVSSHVCKPQKQGVWEIVGPRQKKYMGVVRSPSGFVTTCSHALAHFQAPSRCTNESTRSRRSSCVQTLF